MRRLVKWFLKKKGVDMCALCDDAIATESRRLCKPCSDELYEIEMHDYHRDMMELYYR